MPDGSVRVGPSRSHPIGKIKPCKITQDGPVQADANSRLWFKSEQGCLECGYVYESVALYLRDMMACKAAC
jgi:hypothetical protein